MGIFRTSDPTAFDDVDGIIVDESAPAPNVAGVAANIAILVGQTERGSSDLTDVGSTGEFHEIYGKNDTYGVNKALKKKKFGLLRIIRVVATDAVQALLAFASSATDRITFTAKQGVGAFGNYIQVKIEEASSSLNEIFSITCVADVSSSLDGKYFILADEVGTVGFWIDVANGGGTPPAAALACARQVEITTIAANDSASTVATKIAAAIEADSKFTASALSTVVTATCVAFAPGVGSSSAGDSGFTVTKTQTGVYAGKKYTIKDSSTNAVLPQEVYDNVKIAEVVSMATFAGSNLIEATVNSSAAEPSNCDFTSLEDGDDGTVANSDYETAIAKAEIESAGNVLFLDEYNATRNGYLKAHAAATQDKQVIVCGPESQTVAAAVSDVANFRDTEGRIIYAFPYIQTEIGGVLVYTPPASWLASIISQTAPNIDPAYTANTQFLSGITAMKLSISRAQYIQLKDAGVAAFELDADIGFKLKSGIVTQIADSSKVTILRRRMADYLTASVAKFLKNYQNAVNSAENRTLVKGAIQGFVTSLQNDGILPKDNEVKNGKATLIDTESLNTDATIAAGFFKILWRQRIYSSMRYIVVQAEIGESVVVTDQG